MKIDARTLALQSQLTIYQSTVKSKRHEHGCKDTNTENTITYMLSYNRHRHRCEHEWTSIITDMITHSLSQVQGKE